MPDDMSLRQTRRRRVRWGMAIFCASALLALALPLIIIPRVQSVHSECIPTGAVWSGVLQLPVLVLNSPYGGLAWGNSTILPGNVPPIGDYTVLGTRALNGSSAWSGYEVNVTVQSVSNASVAGGGTDLRCVSPIQAFVKATGNESGGIALLGPGNVSDRSEPNVTDYSNGGSISFDAGFTTNNTSPVSTCGGPAQSTIAVSDHLTVWVNFPYEGNRARASYAVPLDRMIAHYWFPANFGTWAVQAHDTGPSSSGGGDAFAFAPC